MHYLRAANGIFAIYVDNLIGNDSMYYIHKDYQGNMETVTSSNGTILEKLSFDPWGRKRNPDNWTNTASTYHSYFDRGYTMHEHLPVFGIINMNGRLYDPWVGRMLSPDPHVQNPSSVQNYNRYSYALNNPLKYTDPSGYSYKPDDWDDPNSINHYAVAAWGSDGRGGVFDFSGVNARANSALGIAYDGHGYLRTYESIFNSFVEENMPSNTTLNSYTITKKGYWLNTSTVESIPSPEAHLYSTSHMVNMISSFIPGGDEVEEDDGFSDWPINYSVEFDDKATLNMLTGRITAGSRASFITDKSVIAASSLIIVKRRGGPYLLAVNSILSTMMFLDGEVIGGILNNYINVDAPREGVRIQVYTTYNSYVGAHRSAIFYDVNSGRTLGWLPNF